MCEVNCSTVVPLYNKTPWECRILVPEFGVRIHYCESHPTLPRHPQNAGLVRLIMLYYKNYPL